MVKIIKYKLCEKNETMKNKKIAVISVLSGVLSALPFIFKDISPLIFISISPALYCVVKFKKNSFSSMFFYFFSFYLFSDLWMLSIGINFQSNNICGFLLSLFIIISVSLLLAFTAAMPFATLRKIKSDKPLIMITAIPFIYIFGEWVHGIYPLYFPWNRLCNITAYNTEIIQSVSVFGGLFISYIIVLINICLVYSVKYFSENKLKSLLYIVYAILIYQSNIFSGEIISAYYDKKNQNQYNEVLLVQANFSRYEKRMFSSEFILDKYIELSEKNITPDTKLIVFPETAVSKKFFTNNSYKNKLCDFAEKINRDILFGVSYNFQGKLYNSCAVLYPDKTISEIYMKRKLVPFGEYTPSIFPQNIHFVNNTYYPSKKNTIIHSNIGKIGCAICFESIFPFLAADNTQNDAELLAVITNDSWLGNFVPLYQHHGNSILRAVENRKYTITCANTGISSVISSDGKIICASMPNVRETVSAGVYCNNIKTFYAKYGDLIIIPALTIVFVLIIIYFISQNET